MKVFLLFLLLCSQVSIAQEDAKTIADVQKIVNDTLASKWYEKIQLRGYAHFRYNRLFETNNKLNCTGCDRSLGDKQGFFMRRARLTFFGEVSDRVFIYIQPDYSTDAASNSTTQSQSYFQIRDAYFDYALNPSKEWRIRTGISKVPFGFSNLQSSSNRAPIDRDDALNMGTPNERDIGMFLMYSPTEIRKRFKELTSNNLKGSGDYGMIAVGAYNGQTLNRPERNNDLHRLARFTYPFKLKSGQFIETSIQAYEGKFVPSDNGDYYDQRTAASFIYFPQPIGFQLEYNVGMGPEFDKDAGVIKSRNLKGGYAQINYQTVFNQDRYFPYVRYQEYQGGRKLDVGAPSSQVSEWEFGTEWQPNTAFEFTAAYAISDRRNRSSTVNYHEKGQMLRLQAQFNY